MLVCSLGAKVKKKQETTKNSLFRLLIYDSSSEIRKKKQENIKSPHPHFLSKRRLNLV